LIPYHIHIEGAIEVCDSFGLDKGFVDFSTIKRYEAAAPNHPHPLTTKTCVKIPQLRARLIGALRLVFGTLGVDFKFFVMHRREAQEDLTRIYYLS
jgi:hypothetical protein